MPEQASSSGSLAQDVMGAPACVLIVDDDTASRSTVAALLSPLGYRLRFASDGEEALASVQEEIPDLVLMDVMMPEMDGYEAMRRIRATEEFKTIPMIALTAKAMKGDREKCMEAGASDYITKPIDAQQLVSLLRVWLYR